MPNSTPVHLLEAGDGKTESKWLPVYNHAVITVQVVNISGGTIEVQVSNEHGADPQNPYTALSITSDAVYTIDPGARFLRVERTSGATNADVYFQGQNRG